MKTPFVAIVGRPNVGKSTLFNRIIRQRKAIVDEQPGITRDRLYSTTTWRGIKFTLVDTGGYLPQSKSEIEREIKLQVDEAINEADKILFVLDGQTMVTDLDLRIRKILLKSNKNTIAVINKIDSREKELFSKDFYQLGFNDIICVSALTGRNIGDLLDIIVKDFEKNDKTVFSDDKEYIKIAVVGKPNVGKSSFINAIIGEEKLIVTEIPGTTIDSIDLTFRKDNKNYKIIDTAGIRKKRKIQEKIEYYSSLRTIKSIEQADVVIIMIDARDGLQAQDIKIVEMCEKAGKGMILVFNKWDLIKKDEKTFIRYEKETKEKLKSKNYIPMISSSALTGKRTFKVIELCESVYNEGRKKIDTPVFNNFLAEIIKQKHPSSFKGKRISIKYGCQTGILPPEFELFTNDPRGIKSDYIRYIENNLREKFGFTGFPVKLYFKKKSRIKYG